MALCLNVLNWRAGRLRNMTRFLHHGIASALAFAKTEAFLNESTDCFYDLSELFYSFMKLILGDARLGYWVREVRHIIE